MPEYQPGVCNINSEGVEYRRTVGNNATVIGLGLLFVAILFMTGAAVYIVSLLAIATVFIGILNYLQARNSFCVSHGTAGTQQAADGSMKAEEVTDKDALAKDQARSQQMLLQAAGISIVIVVVIVLLEKLLF